MSESLLVNPRAQHIAGACEIKHELKQYTVGQLSLGTYWFLLMVLYHVHLPVVAKFLSLRKQLQHVYS